MLDGFLQSLKQGEPSDDRFHQVIEAILELGVRLHCRLPRPTISRTCWATHFLHDLTLHVRIAAGTPKGVKRKVGTIARIRSTPGWT